MRHFSAARLLTVCAIAAIALQAGPVSWTGGGALSNPAFIVGPYDTITGGTFLNGGPTFSVTDLVNGYSVSGTFDFQATAADAILHLVFARPFSHATHDTHPVSATYSVSLSSDLESTSALRNSDEWQIFAYDGRGVVFSTPENVPWIPNPLPPVDPENPPPPINSPLVDTTGLSGSLDFPADGEPGSSPTLRQAFKIQFSSLQGGEIVRVNLSSLSVTIDDFQAVPEPSVWLTVPVALACLAALRRSRLRR